MEVAGREVEKHLGAIVGDGQRERPVVMNERCVVRRHTPRSVRFEIDLVELIQACRGIERPSEKQDLAAIGRHSDARGHQQCPGRDDPVQSNELTRL